MNKDILMELDREFCEETQKHGAKGWAKYFWDDAQMVTGQHNENIKGLENIEKAMDGFFKMGEVDFRWEPMISELSEDGTMGFTLGKYTRKVTVDGKTQEGIGKYTTIWVKRDGVWKIILDTGN